MAVRAGDTVVTGPGSDIMFVAGRDAMLVRQNSNFALAEDGFRLVTGAVLGVFAPRQRKNLHTATATIGIRGTAVYLEAEPHAHLRLHLLWRDRARAARTTPRRARRCARAAP